MAANVYEGMFILDANRFGRDPEAISGQIPAMIEKLGGEILVSRLWEERRLAFPIKGQRKGAYWLTYFRLDGGQLVDLRRQCRIADDILRTLFLKVDPRIVDALVAHAQSVSTVPHDKPEEGKPEGKVEDKPAETEDKPVEVAVAVAVAEDTDSNDATDAEIKSGET
ncbi:MAG: 30S ribosomal protein S6 [Pirellulales bacterium]|nr:30S ribosomal protein S6 [Pirellulales bacterium]